MLQNYWIIELVEKSTLLRETSGVLITTRMKEYFRLQRKQRKMKCEDKGSSDD